MNVDCTEIRVRLRYDDEFLEYDDTVGTVLHELAHMEIGPHNAQFYELVESLELELALGRIASINAHKAVDTRASKRLLMLTTAERRRAG